MMLLSCLQFLLIILYSTIQTCRGSYSVVLEKAPDFIYVSEWVGKEMEIQSVEVMSHFDEDKGDVIHYTQWIRGFMIAKPKQQCHFDAEYSVLEKTLTLKACKCKEIKDEPTHDKVVEWAVNRLGVRLIQVLSHDEVNTTEKIIYTLDLKTQMGTEEENTCFIVAEYFKFDEVLQLKLHMFQRDDTPNFINALQILSKEIDMYNIDIIKHSSEEYGKGILYTFEIKGMNNSVSELVCVVVVDSDIYTNEVIIKSKNCTQLNNLDMGVVGKWISDQLNIEINNIIKINEHNLNDKIVYNLDFEATNVTGHVKVMCSVLVEFLYSTKKFVLKWHICRLDENNNEGPGYKHVAEWAAKYLNFQLIKIISHLENYQPEVIIYTLELEINQESNTDQFCLVIAEHSKTENTLTLKLHFIEGISIDIVLKKVFMLLSDETELTNIRIDTHVEVALEDKTVYALQIQGLNSSQIELSCSITVDCSNSGEVCILKSNTCMMGQALISYTEAISWISQELHLDIIKITKKKQENQNNNILFIFELNVRNKTGHFQICTIVVEYTTSIKNFVKKWNICRPDTDAAHEIPGYETVLEWTVKELHLELIQLLSHSEVSHIKKTVYTLQFTASNTTESSLSCFVLVEFHIIDNRLHIKLHSSNLLTIDAKYEEVLKLIGKKIDLYQISIISHTEVTQPDGTLYNLEIKGDNNTKIQYFCKLLVECKRPYGQCILTSEECNPFHTTPKLSVTEFVSQEMHLEILLLTHETSEPFVNKISYNLQFLAKNVTEFHQSCTVNVEYIITEETYELKNSLCTPNNTLANTPQHIEALNWFLSIYNVTLNKVISHTEKYSFTEVTYMISFMGKDIANKEHMYFIIVNYSNNLKLFSLKIQSYGLININSVYKDVLILISENTVVKNMSVTSHFEKSFNSSMLYTVQVSGVNITLFVSCKFEVECTIAGDKCSISTNVCRPKGDGLYFTRVIAYIAKKLHLEILRIVQKSHLTYVNKIVHNVEFKAKNSSGVLQICKVSAEFIISNKNIILKIVKCKEHDGSVEIPHYSVVVRWAVNRLKIKLVRVIRHVENHIDQNALYFLTLTAVNSDQKEQMYFVSVEYSTVQKKFFLKLHSPELLTVDVKYEEVLKLISKTVDVYNITIINHKEEVSLGETTYHLEIKANNITSKLMCQIVVSCSNNRQCVLTANHCSAPPYTVFDWISESLHMEVLKVVTETQKTTNDIITYNICIKTKNASETIIFCNMVVDYIIINNNYILNYKKCRLNETDNENGPELDEIVVWTVNTLNIQLIKVVEHTESKLPEKIVHVLEIKATNVSKLVQEYLVVVEFLKTDYKLHLKLHSNLLTINVNYKEILLLIANKTETYDITTLTHAEEKIDNRYVYTLEVVCTQKLIQALTCHIVAECTSSCTLQYNQCANTNTYVQMQEVLYHISKELQLQITKIENKTENIVYEDIIYDIHFKGENFTGISEVCSVQVQYMISIKKFVINVKKCVESKNITVIPDFLFVVKWFTELKHIKEVDVINHTQTYEENKVVYVLELQESSETSIDKVQFAVVEYSMVYEELHLKLQTSDFLTTDIKYKEVLTVIANEMNIYNMQIVTHLEENQQHATVYTIDLTGKNSTVTEEKCKLLIECKHVGGSCILTSKHCYPVSTVVNTTEVIKWISETLGIDVVKVIQNKTETIQNNVIFTLEFEAKNTTSLYVCNAVVEYVVNEGKFSFDSKECVPNDVKPIPNYVQAAQWFSETVNISLVSIVKHVEAYEIDKVVFTLQTSSQQNEIKKLCLALVEYSKKENMFQLMIHSCDLSTADNNFEYALILISKKTHFYNVSVLSFGEEHTDDKVQFTIQIKGTNITMVEHMCNIVVECWNADKCIIKRKICNNASDVPLETHVLTWLKTQLDLHIIRIVHTTQEVIKQKITFYFEFDAKSKTEVVYKCQCVVEYDIIQHMYVMKFKKFIQKDDKLIIPDHTYVSKWTTESINLQLIEIVRHVENYYSDKVVYILEFKAKNQTETNSDLYIAVVEYSKVTNTLNLIIHSSDLLTVDTHYEEVIILITKKINVYNSKVISHSEESAEGNIIYNLEIKGSTLLLVEVLCKVTIEYNHMNGKCALTNKKIIPLNSVDLSNIMTWTSKQIQVEIVEVLSQIKEEITEKIIYKFEYNVKNTTEEIQTCRVTVEYIKCNAELDIKFCECKPQNTIVNVPNHQDVVGWVADTINVTFVTLITHTEEITPDRVEYVLQFEALNQSDTQVWFVVVNYIKKEGMLYIKLKTCGVETEVTSYYDILTILSKKNYILNMGIESHVQEVLTDKIIHTLEITGGTSETELQSCIVKIECMVPSGKCYLKTKQCTKGLDVVQLTEVIEFITEETHLDVIEVVNKTTEIVNDVKVYYMTIQAKNETNNVSCQVVIDHNQSNNTFVLKWIEISTDEHLNFAPVYTKVVQWVSETLNVNLFQTVSHKESYLTENIIYTVKFKTDNISDVNNVCVAVVVYSKVDKKLYLKVHSFNMKEDQPDLENLLKITTNEIQNFNLTILTQHIVHVKDKAIYVLEVKGGDDKVDKLYKLVINCENNQCLVKFKNFTVSKIYTTDMNAVVSWITQKLQVENVHVINVTEEKLNNDVSYIMQFQGQNIDGNIAVCNVVIQYNIITQKYVLKFVEWKPKIPKPVPTHQNVLTWVSEIMNVQYIHAINHIEKYTSQKIVYVIQFEAVNKTEVEETCLIFVEYLKNDSMVHLKLHYCGVVFDETYEKVLSLITKKIETYNITVLTHHEEIINGNTEYTIEVNGKNGSIAEETCSIIVICQQNENCSLKSKVCKPVVTYTNIVQWVSQQLELEVIQIINKTQNVLNENTVFNVEFQAKNSTGELQTCIVAVEFITSQNNFILKYKDCKKAKPIINYPDYEFVSKWVTQMINYSLINVVEHRENVTDEKVVYILQTKTANTTSSNIECWFVVEFSINEHLLHNKLYSCGLLPTKDIYKDVLVLVTETIKVEDTQILTYFEQTFQDKTIITLHTTGSYNSTMVMSCEIIIECINTTGKCDINNKNCEITQGGGDFIQILQVITQKLNYQVIQIVNKTEELENTTRLFYYTVKVSTSLGVIQICELVVEYVIQMNTIVLKYNQCKIDKKNVTVNYSEAVKWVTQQMNVELLEVTKHVENFTDENTVYTMEIKIKNTTGSDQICFVIVEFIKVTQQYVLKIHSCGPLATVENHETVLTLITNIVHIENICIITYQEKPSNEKVIYILDVKGNSSSTLEQTCTLTIECTKITQECVEISKRCLLINNIIDFEDVKEFINVELNLDIVNIVKKTEEIINGHVTYYINFQAKNHTGLLQMCKVVLEVIGPGNIVVNNLECKVYEDHLVIPDYKSIVEWVVKIIDVELVEIVNHLENYLLKKTTYQLEFTAMNHSNSEILCYVLAEYLNAQQVTHLLLHSCGLLQTNPTYEKVFQLLIKKMQIYNIRVVTHVEETVGDTSIFTLTIKGSNNSLVEQTCDVVIECTAKPKRCILKSKNCYATGGTVEFTDVLKWISKVLNIQIIHVIHKTEDTINANTVFNIQLQAVNTTGTSTICTFIVENVMQQNQLTFNYTDCKLVTNHSELAAPDHISVVHWMETVLNMQIVQVIQHIEKNVKEHIIYTLQFQVKNSSGNTLLCFAVVQYSKKDSTLYLKLHTCSATSANIHYQNILTTISKAVNIQNITILSHHEEQQNDKLISVIEIAGSNSSLIQQKCALILECIMSKCIIKSKRCTMMSMIVDFADVTNWLQTTLNLNILTVIQNLQTTIKNNIIFNTELQVNNNSVIQICNVSVQFVMYNSSMKLIDMICNKNSTSLIPDYSKVVEWVGVTTQVKIIEIIRHMEKYTKDKVIYTLEYKATNYAHHELLCYAIVEYHKYDEKLLLVINNSNLLQINSFYEDIFVLISKKVHMYNMVIVSHNEDVLGNKNIFVLEINGKNTSKTETNCTLIVECDESNRKCVITTQDCVVINTEIDFEEIINSLSQTLHIQIINVTNKTKVQEEGTVLIFLAFEGKNEVENTVNCNITMQFIVANSTLTLTTQDCTPNASSIVLPKPPAYGHVLTYIMKIMNLQLLETTHHTEKYFADSVVYCFQVKVNNITSQGLICLILAYYSIKENVLQIKIHTCSSEQINPTSEEVMMVIAQSVQLFDMTVTTYEEEFVQNKLIFTYQVTGFKNTSEASCTLVIECSKITKTCQLTTETCLPGRDVLIKDSIGWISTTTNLQINEIINQTTTNEEKKTVFNIYFEGKDVTGKLLICLAKVEHHTTDNKVIVTVSECRPSENNIVTPNYEKIIQWTSKVIKVQILEVNHHIEKYYQDKIVYMFQVKVANASQIETYCFVLAEYSLVDNTLNVQLHSCGPITATTNYEQIFYKLTEKLTTYNMQIISHMSQTTTTGTLYTFVINGRNSTETYVSCNVESYCAHATEECKVTSKVCSPLPPEEEQLPSFVDNSIFFSLISDVLHIKVTKVEYQTQEILHEKVVYDLGFEAKNQSYIVDCGIFIEYSTTTGNFDVKEYNCEKNNNSIELPNHNQVFVWAVEKLGAHYYEIVSHQDIQLIGKHIYTFQYEGVDSSNKSEQCLLIVGYTFANNQTYIKLHSCGLLTVHDFYQQILLLLAKELSLQNIYIVTHVEQLNEDKEMFILEVKGMEGVYEISCSIIIQCYASKICKIKSKDCEATQEDVTGLKKWLSQKLTLEIIKVTEQTKNIIEGSVIHHLNFEAKNGTVLQHCSVVVDYVISSKETLLKWYDCKSTLLNQIIHPAYTIVLNWALKLLKIGLVENVQHFENNFFDKTIYILKFKTEKSICFVIVEFSKTDQVLYLIFNNCDLLSINPKFEKVFLLIAQHLHLYNMDIISHVVEVLDGKTEFIVEVQGSKCSLMKRKCSLIITCRESEKFCVLDSKSCIDVDNIVTFEDILQIVSKKLHIEIIELIKKTQHPIADNVLYHLHIKARNTTGDIHECTLIFEHKPTTNIIHFKLYECLPEGKIIVPNLGEVIDWVAQRIKVKFISIIHHVESYLNSKIMFTLKFKGEDISHTELICFAAAIYLNKNLTLKLQFHSCGKIDMDPKYEQVFLVIAKKVHLYDQILVAHHEETLADKTVYTLESKGESDAGVQRTCTIIVECIEVTTECSLTFQKCITTDTASVYIPNYQSTLDWTVGILKLNVTKIVDHFAKDSTEEVVYAFVLEVENNSTISICTIVVEYSKMDQSLTLQLHSCSSQSLDAVYAKALVVICQRIKLFNIEVISHIKETEADLIAYNIMIKGSNGSSSIQACRLVVTCQVSGDHCTLKSKWCVPENSLADLSDVVKWISKQLQIQIIKIIRKTEEIILDKIIYNLEFLANNGTNLLNCRVIIEYDKGNNVFVLKDNRCVSQTSLVVPSFQNVAEWIVNKVSVELIHILSHVEKYDNNKIIFELKIEVLNNTQRDTCLAIVFYVKNQQALFMKIHACGLGLEDQNYYCKVLILIARRVEAYELQVLEHYEEYLQAKTLYFVHVIGNMVSGANKYCKIVVECIHYGRTCILMSQVCTEGNNAITSFENIVRWISKELELEIVHIINKSQQTINNNILFMVQFLAKDGFGGRQVCRVVVQYEVTQNKLSLKSKTCVPDKENPVAIPNYDSILKWISNQLNVELLQIVSHQEKDIGPSVVIQLIIIVKNQENIRQPCLILLEYLKIQKTLELRLHECSLWGVAPNTGMILQLIIRKINLKNIKIITHDQNILQNTIVHLIQLTGTNSSLIQHICSVIIKCRNTQETCYLQSRKCLVENTSPNFKKMLQFVSDVLHLQIYHIISKNIENVGNIIYNVEFLANSAATGNQICTVIVVFVKNQRQYILKSSTCGSETAVDVPNKLNPKTVIMWAVKQIHIKLIKVLNVETFTVGSALVYVYEITAGNFAHPQDFCVVAASYNPSNKGLIIKFHMCGLDKLDSHYRTISKILVKELNVYNIRIISHVEIRYNDRTLYKLQISAIDESGAQQSCIVVAECTSYKDICKMKENGCVESTKEPLPIEDPVKWMMEHMNLGVVNVVNTEEYILNDKVVYNLELESSSSSSITSTCSVVIEYVKSTRRSELITNMCNATDNDGYVPDANYVAQTVAHMHGVKLMHFVNHSVENFSDQLLFVLYLQIANVSRVENCMYFVQYFQFNRRLSLKLYDCSQKILDSGFKLLALLLIKELKIYNINILDVKTEALQGQAINNLQLTGIDSSNKQQYCVSIIRCLERACLLQSSICNQIGDYINLADPVKFVENNLHMNVLNSINKIQEVTDDKVIYNLEYDAKNANSDMQSCNTVIEFTRSSKRSEVRSNRCKSRELKVNPSNEINKIDIINDWIIKKLKITQGQILNESTTDRRNKIFRNYLIKTENNDCYVTVKYMKDKNRFAITRNTCRELIVRNTRRHGSSRRRQ